jgi:hypothetical protein
MLFCRPPAQNAGIGPNQTILGVVFSLTCRPAAVIDSKYPLLRGKLYGVVFVAPFFYQGREKQLPITDACGKAVLKRMSD